MVEAVNVRAGIGMTSARTRGRMVERLRELGIRDETVLAAMGAVPRHLFVDQALESRAYEDTALPIGFGQTISHPYLVARRAELARHGESGQGRALGRVLEIGLGCGYQAAVLGKLAREVVSIDRIAALVGKTRARLRELRVNNVKPKHGDGMHGAKDFAPSGASDHARAGDTSSASPVCRVGIAPPSLKAELVNCMPESAKPMIITPVLLPVKSPVFFFINQ